MCDSDDEVPTYSRDEVVAELSSYYEFLTRIFLPPSVVRYPPEGGWEHINRDWIRTFSLGKNDTVLDLMKHIPYIRRDEEDDFEPWQIFERTTAVDCAGHRAVNFPGESQREFLFEAWTLKVPAHVYVLANHPTGRNGHDIYIDTERGTVVLADVQVGPKPTKLSQVDSPSGDEEWQEHATYTVTGFFTKLKNMWRNYELYAIERRTVLFGPPDKSIVKIYRQEGLFTEGYDREGYMDKLERHVNLEYFHFRPVTGKRKHEDISE